MAHPTLQNVVYRINKAKRNGKKYAYMSWPDIALNSLWLVVIEGKLTSMGYQVDIKPLSRVCPDPGVQEKIALIIRWR